MSRNDLLLQLEQLVKVSAKSLQGHEELSNLPGWDSLTQLHFVILVEKSLGIRLTSGQMADCRTVDDLLAIFDKPSV